MNSLTVSVIFLKFASYCKAVALMAKAMSIFGTLKFEI